MSGYEEGVLALQERLADAQFDAVTAVDDFGQELGGVGADADEVTRLGERLNRNLQLFALGGYLTSSNMPIAVADGEPPSEVIKLVGRLGETAQDVAMVFASAGVYLATAYDPKDSNASHGQAKQRSLEILTIVPELFAEWIADKDGEPSNRRIDDKWFDQLVDVAVAWDKVGGEHDEQDVAGQIDWTLGHSITKTLAIGDEGSAERAAGFARKVGAVFKAFDRAVGIKPEFQSVRTYNFLEDLRRLGNETSAQAFLGAYETTE